KAQATTAARYLIAVSKQSDVPNGDANTNGSWRMWAVDSQLNNAFSDYPSWGVNGDAVFVTANYFGSNGFAGTSMRIFPKAQFAQNPTIRTLQFTEVQNIPAGGQQAQTLTASGDVLNLGELEC